MIFLIFYQISRFSLVSKFKWILARKVSGLMVQVGYDVALTRRKSGVQIPVGPFLSSKKGSSLHGFIPIALN
jgi:hypothetical protein